MIEIDWDKTLFNVKCRGVNLRHFEWVGGVQPLIQDIRAISMILHWYNFHSPRSLYNSYLQFWWTCGR